MSKQNRRYVVCVNNAGYHVSLDLRKIYESVADREAETHNLIRVFDESGEDYLYPSQYFLPIDLPEHIRAALRRAS